MLTQNEVKIKINELIAYAIDNLSLKSDDQYFVLNLLLDLFKLDAPGDPISKYGDFQKDIVDPLVEYAVSIGLTTKEECLLFETKLLNYVTPTPSAVVEKFDIIAANKTVQDATDWMFNLSKNCNYIRMCDINKNIMWDHKGKFGPLKITINLSKPEKDPKAIALAKLQPQTAYPKCMLCLENIGFAGNLNKPARQTLRTIPIELNNEPWHLQYSPYQYYDQHVIAFADEHRPMKVTSESFRRLLDFVDLFPHYFIGSNAALPIVGGSILTHDHYQGGNKVLPMFKVDTRKRYESADYKDAQVYIVNWYNSVVRVESENKESALSLASEILNKWNNYTDETVGIYCKTDEQHNTVTPIARKENGKYIIDMILRNNRTDEAHPYGIFHAAEHLHNIKKEGIGIIEVMGLFILPGRLKKEFELMTAYLTGKKDFKQDIPELTKEDNPLSKHFNMLAQLINDNDSALTSARANTAIRNYVNKACEEILECTAVFKNDKKGQEAFEKFMKEGLGLTD